MYLQVFKKILITGGCGFIGSTLIKKLLKDTESQIVNIDKLGYASQKEGIKKFIVNEKIKESRYIYFNIDLVNIKGISEIIENFSPDLIYHLAAESHVDRSINSPRDFSDSNIIGTFNLIEATRFFYNKISMNKKKNFKFI